MNQTDHKTVWNNCLEIIKNNIGETKFDTWFKQIKSVSYSYPTLAIEVPSDYFREHLESAYLGVLKFALTRVIGKNAKLNYCIRTVSNQPPMKVSSAKVETPENKSVTMNTYPAKGNPGAFVYPGIQRLKINPRLNSVYCFENLVEGECNKMGITAGLNISKTPGDTPFNPLFIFGGPGLGKTHLAQAIGIKINETFQDKIVLYVTGNEFKTQYMEAVCVKNKLTDFLAFYLKIDVLIIDDIQDLVGQGSQHAFFNIFNFLHDNKKQLIFASDRPPAELQNFEERLLTRLKWGLSVRLEAPNYETRLEVLRERCNREGVEIEEEVLEYLANNIKSNFRELEGVLISLIAHATLAHKEVSIDLAKEIISHVVREVKKDISIDTIQKTVCNYFNITRDVLLSKTRKRKVVQARQIAMYLCRSKIDCSLSTIGSELGGKDHSTVLHACSTVSDLMSIDRTFRQYVNDIEKMLVAVEK